MTNRKHKAEQLILLFDYHFDNRTVNHYKVQDKLSKLDNKQLLHLISLIDENKVIMAYRQMLAMINKVN
jgi:hypothetical protein